MNYLFKHRTATKRFRNMFKYVCYRNAYKYYKPWVCKNSNWKAKFKSENGQIGESVRTILSFSYLTVSPQV